MTGGVLPRQTLFALLGAYEKDARRIVSSYLGPSMSLEEIFAEEVVAHVGERVATALGIDDPDLATFLDFTDFEDPHHALNRHRSRLPDPVAKHLARHAPRFEKLCGVRNRVCHNRPLSFDDLAVTMEFFEELTGTQPALWEEIRATQQRLSEEPGFVLGLQIPIEETAIPHNLPTPDFDETGFVGRHEYVDNLVSLCRGAFPVITIKGEGGVGKTALALRTAYAVLDLDPCPFDSVVWVSSKSTQLTPTEIAKIEGAITDSLGLLTAVAQELGGDSASDPLDDVLEYLQTFRILLVLDNLETVLDDRVRAFISRLPVGSKVLITSRIGLGAFEMPVDLRAMADGEAVQLLRELTRVRRVPYLTQMDNESLSGYCKKLHNSPGFIKWFVSAVQAGRRPEDILAKSGMFLDFCMSNVYRYLGDTSHFLLDAMQSVPGRHSQAELAFLTSLEIQDLQRALVDLTTTNMLSMTSVPMGSSYESTYEINDLARAYLAKHHPPDPETHAKFGKKRRVMIAAREELKAQSRANPYLARSLHVPTLGSQVVARDLLQALAAVRAGRLNEAGDLVTRAKELAPGWFEVHRVEAAVRQEQGNFAAAQDAYQAAIDLEPEWAPLRFWYALFLVNRAGDTEGAQKQLATAIRLDARSIDLQLEHLRISIYLLDWESARQSLSALSPRTGEVSGWKLRKLYDLTLQLHQRVAEAELEAGRAHAALRELTLLRGAYREIPLETIDERMRQKLSKAVPVVRRCVRELDDVDAKRRGSELATWMLQESARWSETDADVSKELGTLKSILPDKGFGFLTDGRGDDRFFHFSEVEFGVDPYTFVEGAYVRYVPDRDAQGRPRAKSVEPAVG